MNPPRRRLSDLCAKCNAAAAAKPSFASASAQLLCSRAVELGIHAAAASESLPPPPPLVTEDSTPETTAMNPAQVQAHLDSQVSALASGLNLTSAHAIALLRRYGWSCELL